MFAGDRDCQAFRAGGAANIWDLMTWGEEGCGTASDIQDGKCDQCRLGHRGAPYWCDNSGIGVESAEDWMRLYGDDTSLRNFNTLTARQCKFRQEQCHPHGVVCDPINNAVFVADLGSNCVVRWALDADAAALHSPTSYAVENSFAGPRCT